MATPSSGNSWKSNDGVSDQFPAGLRVLVVDDDSICLMILEAMLKKCLYEVTKCNRADIALKLLRDNKNGFDIVISDVYMPDIDGFKLLEEVGLDMDLPVIMMSADDSKDVVMKGVTHGACDYLIKPVRMEALKNIWQHVVRKKKHEWKDKDLEQSASVDDGERKQKALEDVDISSSATDGNGRRKRNDEEDDVDDKDDSGTLKKPRVVWSVELHQQFVAAVNQLGIEKAVPKKILELMNVPGLTRENVASHLQKYRLYLRRLSGVSQHQTGPGSSFLGIPDGSFGTISPLHGFDFQVFRGPGQIPAPGLGPFQPGALVRPSSRPPMSVPVVDQRNLFGFESPKLRYGEAQQQLGSNADQMNLLHGIPTNMEPKQLASLKQSAQTLGGVNLQVNSQASQNNPLVSHMTQPISRTQLLNKSNASPVSTLSASVGQPIVLDGISSGGLGQGGSTNGIRGTIYNPASEASSVVDFSLNGGSQLTGNGFPPRNSGISSLSPQGLIQGEVNLHAKGPQGFVPSYEYLNELQQYKSVEWGLQSVGSTFDASQNPVARGSMEVPPSTFVQPGFSSVQRSGHNRVGVPIFSSGEVVQNSNSNFGRTVIPFVADSSPRVKVETLQDPNCAPNLFSQQYGQDDMLSAILKQQDAVGSVGTEFGYDGYRLDNLPA